MTASTAPVADMVSILADPSATLAVTASQSSASSLKGQVEGTTAHDASGGTINPVAAGGYASAAAPSNVSTDGDIVRQWHLRNGSQVVNIASGGTLVTVGQTTKSGSLPVTIASDQDAVPTSPGNVSSVTTETAWDNATAADHAITVALDGYVTAYVSYTKSGTISGGSVDFEVSPDGGTTWFNAPATFIGGSYAGGGIQTSVATPTPIGSGFFFATLSQNSPCLFRVPVNSAFTHFRVRLTTVITGTGNATFAVWLSRTPVTDTISTNILSGSVTVVQSTAANLKARVEGSEVDNAGFTDGTTRVLPAGFILDETAGTTLTENDVGAARMDSKRALVGVLEDATTRGQRASVSSGGALKANLSLNDTLLSLGQATSANSLPVTIASDQSIGGGTEYTEDAASASDPVGGQVILRRRDTLSGSEVSADGDNIAANATAKGELYVKHTDAVTANLALNDTLLSLGQATSANSLPVTIASDQSIGGGTEYTEDVASASDPVGGQMILRRRDTLSGSEVSADGDNIAANATAKGELYVKHADAIPVTDNAGSITVDNAGTFAVQAATAGDVAHDTADSGNPVKVGMRAIGHGSNPTAVAAADRTDWLANRAGIPFVIGGHPNIQTIRFNFTTAQTDAAIITVSAGTKIVVTRVQVTVDNSSTVFPKVLIGFGTSTTPTTTGVVASHPAVPSGGGFTAGDGSGIIGIGGDGEDLRITATGTVGGNGCDVVVAYYTIES
jgi:hypothetical protein